MIWIISKYLQAKMVTFAMKPLVLAVVNLFDNVLIKKTLY